ncbi:hypothetical protein C4K68_12550 [Pokkaliibacter plantistimulans]|uniref:SPOR domain-containing protein n=1 Tax=Proteobacteria bacterium 228 TaxID=2083153 RepID=A0A2S5KR76_9PROT|nr:SPOR domain-containing protein [Pokkaliibacter plantistimulans]PPC77230.1 hypothetical protein C4K68_12550 [Pokkaliibacter plantistimulans]
MPIELRHRIIGGAALLIVVAFWAVSFWDGAGLPSLPPVPEAMPVRPAVPAIDTYQPQQPVSELDETAPPVANSSVEPSVESADATKLVVPPPPSVAQPAQPVVAETVAPKPAVAPPPAEPKAIKETAPQVQMDTQGVPAAWALQLASFKDQTNADRLQKKLMDSGFKAYQSFDGTLHRVFVGPELDRGKLESIRAQIKQQVKLDAMIVRYQVPK